MALQPSPHAINRPLPLRTYSECETSKLESRPLSSHQHSRRKSAYKLLGHSQQFSRQLSTNAQRIRPVSRGALREHRTSVALPAVPEQVQRGNARETQGFYSHATSPITPKQNVNQQAVTPDLLQPLSYDFSRIDYEIDLVRIMGRGLWSNVYFAQPVMRSRRSNATGVPASPSSPRWKTSDMPCSLYAVKSPSRADAKQIFIREAKVLTALQRSQDACEHIVPCYGFDDRNNSLVFEGVLGGSLEGFVARLSTETELERHKKLTRQFVKLGNDLVAGLQFIHRVGIVHADIKPANILLDIYDPDPTQQPVLRARYIDFSASFANDTGSATNAGGTWDYMAPEQLSSESDQNVPTFASDIWSLGVTLLFIIIGGSPYAAVCGQNDSLRLFRLRNAITSATPLACAIMDPTAKKRMASCQDFVDCCRMALQKDRDRRPSASGWLESFDSLRSNYDSIVN